jgi:hypothetical protein
MYEPLLADVGAPMILLEWPLMLCALVPIIFIEAEAIRRRLKLPYRQAINAAAKANVFSTAVGVPVAWGVMLVVELAMIYPMTAAAEKWHWSVNSPVFYLASILAVAWVSPPTTSWWPITLAAALLLIPTFFASIWLERRSYRKALAEIDPDNVNGAVWSANIWSYGLLFAIVTALFGWQIYKGPEIAPVVKRVEDQPIDWHYLHDIAIASADINIRPKLTDSVRHFETCFEHFQSFISEVQKGHIAVVRNVGRDLWQSWLDQNDVIMYANYTNRTGSIKHFQYNPRGSSQDNLRLEFNPAGFVIRAELGDESFQFDDRGRLYHWRGDKADYWGKPGK